MKFRVAVDTLGFDRKLLKKFNVIYVYEEGYNLDELVSSGVHCMHKDYIRSTDINTTKYEIPCIKRCSLDEKIDIPKMKEYKIGIIVPNYNYGNILEKCLLSIKNQVYKNYEVIFIDDCSTDNSVDKAYEILGDMDNAKIVELKQKRFNGGARNEGYLYLSDDVDYVYYVDSDDWLYDEFSLMKINCGLQRYPDVMFVGIAKFRDGVLKTDRIPFYKDRYEAIRGWSGSCGKVIKKELATRQDCLYNEGTLKEDRNQHRRICIYMNDFELLKEPVYVWNQDNRKSVTSIREKIFWGTSTIRHYADTLQLQLSVKGKDKLIDKYLEECVEKTRKEMESGGDRQW